MAIDSKWIEDAIETFKRHDDDPSEMVSRLVLASRECFDTLRRAKGGGNLTEDSRLTLMAVAMVLQVLGESDWMLVFPGYKDGLDIAAALVASLVATGK